jgi:hypothetical protein
LIGIRSVDNGEQGLFLDVEAFERVFGDVGLKKQLGWGARICGDAVL